VRQSVGALRESPLAQKTLVEAIAGLVEDSNTSGIVSELTVVGEERPLDSKIALTLYRVAQEGLTNIRKHARAQNARLTLTYTPEQVALIVRDDGVGAENVEKSGFGLIGTAERVHSARRRPADRNCSTGRARPDRTNPDRLGNRQEVFKNRYWSIFADSSSKPHPIHRINFRIVFAVYLAKSAKVFGNGIEYVAHFYARGRRFPQSHSSTVKSKMSDPAI
jgi:hypothetical protein